jgi:hypothetical protein
MRNPLGGVRALFGGQACNTESARNAPALVNRGYGRAVFWDAPFVAGGTSAEAHRGTGLHDVRPAGLHESARVRRAIWSVDRRCRDIGFTDNTDPKNIWVQPIDGGAPHPLTTFTDKTINDVVWSPDGKRLAITRGASLADIVLLKGIR